VTILIIPDENDSAEEMDRLSRWLSDINREIPLHVSRFIPKYKYSDRRPAMVSNIYALADIARKNLRYVYTGNCFFTPPAVL
jgi:pyruvate formate lyase activating enzyme